MNLLLINHYAGSPELGMEYRPYYMAREWVRAGHHVCIVAASYSHVRTRQPEMTGGVSEQTIAGITYRWLATPHYSGNGIGRARNIAYFLARAWREAPRLAEQWRPDAVIASSTYPMDIWVARRIARLVRQKPAQVVYEVHDLWPLSLVELTGMSPRHPFVLLCQWAEHAAYRHADRVISILPNVHAHMADRGQDLARLTIVPNGIAPDDWSTASEPLRPDVAAAIARARQAGRAVAGYAGSMGLPNALDTLLDAAGLVKDVALTIVMVGDGHERQRLQARVEREKISNVTMLPAIPKSQIPSFLGAIDFAYIGWQHSPIYRFGIAPNKLMDYMMGACAVLHSVEAGNDPVAESGCGLTVAPESPGAVADGLRRLSALSAEQLREMGARGRVYVLAHNSYPVLARRFVEALKS